MPRFGFPPKPRSRAGLTLVETMVSSAVLAMILFGIFAALMQSRRLTEGSIYQNSAVTIVQGYIEQIKAIEFSDLPYLDGSGTLIPGAVDGVPAQIATRLDQTIPDPLTVSTALPIPALSTILASATPTGVADNLKVIDINRTDGSIEFTGSGNTPNIATDDLRLRLWVWIQDVSDSTIDATQVRAITILYAWRVNDGSGQSRSYASTVRTIRSSVRTN